MASLIVPGSGGLPEDSIPEVPCPVKSGVALATDSAGMPTKVILEVPCSLRCPWYRRRDERHSCAVAVIADEIEGRA